MGVLPTVDAGAASICVLETPALQDFNLIGRTECPERVDCGPSFIVRKSAAVDGLPTFAIPSRAARRRIFRIRRNPTQSRYAGPPPCPGIVEESSVISDHGALYATKVWA